ncbi:DNA excision repair protein ERCC-1 [Typha latifolia]|uniref:DNA excision repair protein ERCC-1 n=1 Tax=Typha latifolia TaxID=4733 RepID=UPI003C2C2DE2
MENAEGAKKEDNNEKKSLIKIPSYQEVYGGTSSSSSQAYNPTPPPSSFSQAFSFLKSSEFYTPPPPQPHLSSAPETTPRTPTLQSSTLGPNPPPTPDSSSSDPASLSLSHCNSSAPNRNAILVSHRQKGNPLLKHIRNVRWVFADIVCDYLLGQSSCALYISLRYHLLHPDYLYYRIRELQKNFKLRIILCHVDVEDVVKPLHEVTRTALLHDCTLLCGWSLEECGRYLETIKVYENKPADSIREQMDTDYLSRLTHALTSIRHVNRTDVVTLGSSFGSLSRIMDASMEELARCPGIGERKVRRLYDTFHEPFRRESSRPSIAIPDTPVKGKSSDEPSSTTDDVQALNENPETSEPEKESGLSVKSALSAAFAKYAKKVRGQEDMRNLVEHSEGSSGAISKDAKT